MNLLLCLQRASFFGVAALAVALILQWVLANRVPASWRVWLWRTALIQTALALIPLAPLAISVLPTRAPIVSAPTKIEAPPMPVSKAPALETLPQAQTAPVENLPPALIEAPSFSETAAKQPAPMPERSQWQWRETLPWIYLLGVAIQLALFARSAVCVRRRIRACTPLEDATLSARLHALAARLKISRVPRLLRSGEGSPFLIGILRPTIVLPQNLDDAHLDAVLAHELAHQRRKDLAWNTLLWALQTLLWFHPLSWISRRFHALEIESACDELTLKLTQIAPKSYGALLIGAEKTPVSPLTAGVNDHFFALQTRLKRLSQKPRAPHRWLQVLFSAAILVSFGTVVPLRLVSRAQGQKKPAPFGAKIIGGTVRDASGNDVAGAEVIYRMAGSSIDNGLHHMTSDAEGRFQLPLQWSAVPAQLWADAGELTTPHATIAITGETVDLQLQSNAWAAVSGRVLDAKKQAIADARVTLRQNIDGNGVKTFSAISDAKGQYNFQWLRPGLSANVTVAKKGYIADYALGSGRIETLEAGQNRAQNFSMKRAASTLAGRVLEKSGVAARGFRVWAEGASDLALTDKDGNFKLSQVLSGHIQVAVTSPNGDRKWLYIPAQGGNQNLVVRLNTIKSYYYGKNGGVVMGPLSPMISDMTAKLVGQQAPALQVVQWSGGVAVPLVALRGQKVLLAFDPTFYNTNQLHDFAHSYAGRVAVMGIKTPSMGMGTYPDVKQNAHTDKVVDQTARKMGFPIGVDTILPTNRGSDGRTLIAYGNAPYVVIGRDGKVIYAGKKLDRAIELATAK